MSQPRLIPRVESSVQGEGREVHSLTLKAILADAIDERVFQRVFDRFVRHMYPFMYRGPSIIGLWGPDDSWTPPSMAMLSDEPRHAGKIVPTGNQPFYNSHPLALVVLR